MDDALPAWIRMARSGASVLTRPLLEAVVTMLAVLATLRCTQLIAPGGGPAVLAVVLCLSLSRSHMDRDLRGRLEAAVALPLVGFVAMGVGVLLRQTPWLGAAVFTAGMFLSIWLRRFGSMARRAGRLIALPFIALLTVPHVRVAAGSAIPAVLVPVAVALLSLLWVTVFHQLARYLRLLPPVILAPSTAAPVPPSSMRPTASTRMAIQMVVALALSFVVGYLCFAERWAWIVLTTVIVNIGNRGRLDVAYKSGLRVLGAAAGTVMAMSLSFHAAGDPVATGLWILAALFFGVWLRPLGYAWWALFVTLALALLQSLQPVPPSLLLWQRLVEIVIGAVIGLASAWFVLPVRSSDVLRRRLADALAAMSEAMDPSIPERTPVRVADALDQIRDMAAPFRTSRRLTRRFRSMQPADWIDTLLACRATAIDVIVRGETPGRVRQAIGAARKSLREPEALLPALQRLREALDTDAQSPKPMEGTGPASPPASTAV
ncbi:FUSC family protein [Dyella sp. AD56]|uniref:FUSC family protein n=2 Tax=unclassified Dyella TaxID=2634549 RepID=UPI000C81B949|nr:FUSC family protein [Dyella sp. AD56]